MRLILNFLALVLLVGAFQSCVSNKKYNELLAAKEASDQALAETQALVQQLEEKNVELQAEMESERARLNGEISSLRSDLNSTKSQIAQVQEKLRLAGIEGDRLVDGLDGTIQILIFGQQVS